MEVEASVEDNSRAIAAAIVGGVVGAMAGYLFFTERGRAWRRQLEPAIDDIARELNHLRSTINKASGVASEGWKLLNETLGETAPPRPRYPTTHQTSPF
jgi:gas vesicle protein